MQLSLLLKTIWISWISFLRHPREKEHKCVINSKHVSHCMQQRWSYPSWLRRAIKTIICSFSPRGFLNQITKIEKNSLIISFLIFFGTNSLNSVVLPRLIENLYLQMESIYLIFVLFKSQIYPHAFAFFYWLIHLSRFYRTFLFLRFFKKTTKTIFSFSWSISSPMSS